MNKTSGRVGKHTAESIYAQGPNANEKLKASTSEKRRSILPALFIAAIVITSVFVAVAMVSKAPPRNANPWDGSQAGIEYYNERDQISFNSETAIGAMVTDANSVASGDLDNDGNLELVSVSYNVLTVWKSTADVWQLWDAYNVGDFAMETGTCVELGDLDNDGWLDIVASDDDTNVWCWKNDGTPFDSWGIPNRITSTAAAFPTIVTTGLVVEDLDVDGWTDVVVTDNSTDGVNVYLCVNDKSPFTGLWGGMADGYIPASAAMSIDAADIDLDGWIDIVVGHESGAVVGWENNEDPFNVIMTKYLLCDLTGRSAAANNVALGDLDNDCDIDVVTADDKEEVYIWQNLGGADSWDPMLGNSTLGVLGYNATVLELADLDNDGWMDIFAGTDNEGRTLTIENDHTCWDDYWEPTLMGVGSEGRVLSAAVGDLEGDGDLDCISGHDDISGGGNVLSWENVLMHRNMPFISFEYVDYGNAANGGALGDLDNDGDLDGIVARILNATDGELLLIENRPTSPMMYSIEVSASLNGVAVADLDLDGDLDIVGGIAGYLYIWNNSGDPWSVPWPRTTVETDLTLGYNEISTADFDIDGDVDIVAGCSGGAANRLRAYQNDGTPFNGGWAENHVASIFPGIVVSLDVTDVDNNGSIDIVAGGNLDGSNQLVVFDNDKSPFTGFWPGHDIGNIGVSSDPMSMDAADYDNDGYADLAVAEGFGSNRVYMLENDGTPYNGLWSATIANTLLDDPWSLAAADFDLDGDLDLAVGSGSGETYEAQVLENSGSPFSGAWTSQDVGAPDSRVNALTAGDMDNDGDADIITLCQNARLYLWWNIGTQVTESVTDVSPPTFDAGTSSQLLRIRVGPNGAASDRPAFVKAWCFRVCLSDGTTPLTPSEMNETFASYSLYKDDGDLVWEELFDGTINLTTTLRGNAAILNVSSLEANASVAQGSTADIFFVVELQLGATISGIRVTYDPDEWNSSWGGNLMEIQGLEKALSIMPSNPLTTGLISIIAIPEFPSLIVPVIGMMIAFIVVSKLKRNRKTS